MKYLGIDYGSKKVGLAISDDEGSFAFPYKIIPNNMELLDSIHNICGEENITAIVIGESLDFSCRPNKVMGSIEDLRKTLEIELELPVYYEKEFMTSVFARGSDGKEVNNARKVKQKDKGKIDDSAAALILQRFLDKKNVL